MKKFGFTLAEALVTLGIIGVIAAITIPNITAGARNQANATKLASTVADLETAFQKMMLNENTQKMSETTFWDSDEISNLGPYLKIEKIIMDVGDHSLTNDFGYTSESPFTGINGGNMEDFAADSMAVLNSGAIIALCEDFELHDISSADVQSHGFSASSFSNYHIGIDVNGAAPPNRFGRDVFYFALGDDGSLYPYGSEILRFSSNNEPPYSDSCTDENMGTGYGCTARLVENGYKVDY